MLTAKQINDLPIGFTPVISISTKSRGKSTRFKHYNQQVDKVHQTLPSGKVILRLQPRPFVNILISKNQSSFKGCKWRNKEQLAAANKDK